MSATRTQVYLTEEQRRRIDAITRSEGLTLAEVVRKAIDRYLLAEDADPIAALAATFGAASDIEPPNRAEWDRG